MSCTAVGAAGVGVVEPAVVAGPSGSGGGVGGKVSVGDLGGAGWASGSRENGDGLEVVELEGGGVVERRRDGEHRGKGGGGSNIGVGL